jgi:protein SCO1/2
VNKRALLAVMLAILVPLTCYLIVKQASKTAIHMPGRYFPDTVITRIERGKETSDTVWHKLPDISLQNQQGQTVTWNELEGKIVVADFFFTHCPTICPRLTENMRRVQQSITNAQRVGDQTPDFVHFLSFSIDPERDSVPQLKKWADRFQINPEQWWLLTGDKKMIYDLAINDMKLPTIDGHGVDTSFIHTDRFVLIDANRHIRGYYHGLDTNDIKRISSDIILLTMEKDPAKKSFLAGKFVLLSIVFSIAIVAVAILLFVFRKRS